MQDQYAGQAGTFMVDIEAGIRVPAEQWESYQMTKTQPVNTETTTEEPRDNASHP